VPCFYNAFTALAKAKEDHANGPNATPAERLLKRVAFEPMTGCWLWTGGTLAFGYGVCRMRGFVETSTHRLSWLIFRGPIPKGLCVLHRCDTPQCVNPRHLFLGTRADNNYDRTAKGRSRGRSNTPQRPPTSHCPKCGIERTEENTLWRMEGGRRYVRCRPCRQEQQRLGQKHWPSRLAVR
jgi:hypothetical protein